jgi:hypothetical protein
MNPKKRYQANPVVSCGVEEDGAILFNPDTDDTSVVNLSGKELWFFLKTPRTIAEMVKKLLHSYSQVSVEQATEDVELFIRTLSPDFLLEMNDEK